MKWSGFILVVLTLAFADAVYAQKLTGKKLLGMLGKDESSVTSVLGEPAAHQKVARTGFQDSWGKAPHYTYSFRWKEGAMTGAILQGSSSWRASLARYGLKAAGVTARDVGENDLALDGVQGLPKGWTCRWNSTDHELYFSPKPRT